MFPVRLQRDPEKTIERLAKKEKARFGRVERLLGKISSDPYSDSEVLKDPKLKGFRRVKEDKERIVYQVCGECRKNTNIMKSKQCIDCATFPDDTVMVFDIDTRSKIMYEKKHKRR